MLKYIFGSIASVGVLALAGCEEPSTIGGTEVPAGLVCEEDEAIQFVAIDTLGCVPIEHFIDVALRR